MKSFMCLVSFTCLLYLSGCNTQTYEAVEVFQIDLLELSDQSKAYDQSGYKIVNSITTTSETRNMLKADIKAIEDHFDPNGNYVKTVILHSKSTLNKLNDTLTDHQREEILDQPSTIFFEEEFNEAERELVKARVMEFIDRLPTN
ncbi:hypothetical protein [Halalkalibacter akibai]|nr:hypothetical protein [Halalkalibacter akibai]